MLQIQHISKQYHTGALVQMALNDVSLNLRDNEFISILGPSGSGKTTLLNIIGGLDRYDSGDLIIDGISTKRYNSKAWDSYRNHSIGFVFQSYNLIPHQTVLANVELALTISGVKGSERKQKAMEALKEVGLEEHIHKRPNQLSGGQMQRVAIARALVNDPKILLADEPTGALDTETGIQVMEILKKVAEKRLVVMVTHNPELAEEYSTRIVKLKDGKIIGDSNPFDVPENNADDKKVVTFGKSKMSFITSLALSFNNLRTKKARTIITSVAGSIGIIGIALILALSSGVNDYIMKIQRETMESYPITIDAATYDYSDYFEHIDNADSPYADIEQTDGSITPIIEDYSSDYFYTPKMKKNNLSKFLKFLNNPDNHLDQYIGTGSIISVYNTQFQVYTKDKNGKMINTNGNMDNSSYMFNDNQTFFALPQGRDSTISKKTMDSYNLVYGKWPENANECIIVTDSSGGITASNLTKLGYYTVEDFEKMYDDVSFAKKNALNYEDICNKEFIVLPAAYKYQKNKDNLFDFIPDSEKEIEKSINEHGIKLKVTGIISPAENNDNYSAMLGGFSGNTDGVIGYTYKLTDKLLEESADSPVVKAQLDSVDNSVLTGIEFLDDTNADVVAAGIRKIMKNLSEDEKLAYKDLIESTTIHSGIGDAPKLTDEEYFKAFDKWVDSQSDSDIIMMGSSYLGITTTRQDTLDTIGYANADEPVSIVIYPDTFEGKQGIMNLLEKYNNSAGIEGDTIEYVDYIKELTEQISTIINTISGILIAFVAVSLVVSCIMIGIITHISVLERTKEIGILRALGASRGNISQVFNAETFIIGALSGLLGIIIAALLCIPANVIINSMMTVENSSITVYVPIIPALILIGISILITMFGGLIPASAASRKDPVVALRTE